MKQLTRYSIEADGRKVSNEGAGGTCVGPFVSLFNDDRRVHERIADQSPEYLRNGRILALGVDQLIEDLWQKDTSAETDRSHLTVRVGEQAMSYLEDLDREAHDFVNVIVNPYTHRGEAGVMVFDLEGHPTLAMAMEASNDRVGGSAEVWTIDLTVIEVAMKQVTASELGSYEIEQRATKLLADFGAEFWHSGGGIMLCELEFPKVKKDMLVSESQESPGRFWLGIYDVANGERNEEDEMFDLLDSEQLIDKVKELATTYQGWTRPEPRQ